MDRRERTFLVGLVISPETMTSDGCKCNVRVSSSDLINPSSNSSQTISPVEG